MQTETGIALSVLLAALGLFALLMALVRLLRIRLFAAARSAFSGALLLVVAAALFLVSSNLHGYARLTREEPVAEISFETLGPQLYRATLARAPTGAAQSFALAGDDWQLDARVLKWSGIGNLLGLETLYRLERLGGRYRELEQERTAPRTVHSLAEAPLVDLWALAREKPRWLPFVDALYGSATYLPMADGARYRVTISPSGLVARPMNEAAEQANRGSR